MSRPSRALIMRFHQKDCTYIQKLQMMLLDTIQPFIYNRHRSKAIEGSNVVSRLVYYMSTTAQCLQTLGEEYAGLIVVCMGHTRTPKVPTPMVLRLYAISQSLSAIFSRMVIGTLLGYLRICRSCSPVLLQQLRSSLNAALRIVGCLNTALFYVCGDGHRLSQRFFQIGHLAITPTDDHDNWTTAMFRIIGLVNLYRCLRDLWAIFGELLRVGGDTISIIPRESPSDVISGCSLCLDNPCQDATAAPCGHVFCWHCVVEATRTCNECPLCRSKCHPSRLVLLQNV